MRTEWIGEVLVVWEGPERVRWAHETQPLLRPTRIEEWQVGELWPNAEERSELTRRIASGAPVVVLLSSAEPVVELPVEHVRTVPAGVECKRSVDIVRITVPVLDWLPEPHRTRGLALAARWTARIRTTPRALQAPVLLDDDPGTEAGVRFAFLTGRPLSDGMLRTLIAEMMASRDGAALATAG